MIWFLRCLLRLCAVHLDQKSEAKELALFVQNDVWNIIPMFICFK